jgi:hypothetical protein
MAGYPILREVHIGAGINFSWSPSGSTRFLRKDPGEAEGSRIPEVYPEIDPESMIRWLTLGAPPKIYTTISNNIRCLTVVVPVPQRPYASHTLGYWGPDSCIHSGLSSTVRCR